MTSEKWAQKFHTDGASLPGSGSCFWLVEANFPRGTTNQKHDPDLDSDASSVWNFCAHFSDVIWRETSDGVVKCGLLFFHTTKLKTIFDCGLEAVDSGFQDWIPDSVIVEKGFRILFITGIPDSLSCILESKARDSGIHEPKFAPFQNPEYLTLATKNRTAL